MAQNDVYNKLLALRKCGDDNYYSVAQICKMLNYEYPKKSIQNATKRLEEFRFIEYDYDEALRLFIENKQTVRKYRAVV
jgi:hypothetical protein